MSERQPWEADHPLTQADVEGIVARHAMDGMRGPVASLGEGWDYRAFVAGDDVLRFAKRPDVVAQMRVEARVLQLIAPRVPVAVPRLAEWPPEPEAPHGFTLHAKLPGRPLLGLEIDPGEATALSSELGRFVASLHAIPVAQARACGVHAPEWSSPASAARRSSARLRAIAGRLAKEIVAGAERQLAAPPLPAAGDAVVAHADLWPEHLLVDEASRGLTGIIDWGDVQVGDAADDFAGAWFLAGDEGLDACLQAAGVPWSHALAARSRFWGVHHAVGSAWYAVEQGNEAEWRLATSVLERLA